MRWYILKSKQLIYSGFWSLYLRKNLFYLAISTSDPWWWNYSDAFGKYVCDLPCEVDEAKSSIDVITDGKVHILRQVYVLHKYEWFCSLLLYFFELDWKLSSSSISILPLCPCRRQPAQSSFLLHVVDFYFSSWRSEKRENYFYDITLKSRMCFASTYQTSFRIIHNPNIA